MIIVKSFAEGNEVEVTGVQSNVEGSPALLLRELKRLNPPTSDLLVRYTFNEGTGNAIKDLSDNHFDAKLKNGAKWQEGVEGKAITRITAKRCLRIHPQHLRRDLTRCLFECMGGKPVHQPFDPAP